MRVLENLQPERVFYHFEEIAKIPHGSGNTKQISDYLVAFAKEHNLEHYQDEINNVIMIKEATEGYENADAVINTLVEKIANSETGKKVQDNVTNTKGWIDEHQDTIDALNVLLNTLK